MYKDFKQILHSVPWKSIYFISFWSKYVTQCLFDEDSVRFYTFFLYNVRQKN